MDDEIIHAGYERKAWAAAHQVATREAHIGIQCVAQKQRPPSQNAESWAGSIVCTNDTDIGILVSKDIWANMKSIVLMLQAQVLENPEVDLCAHSLISEIGTLGYGTQSYNPLTAYLKGLNITIDGWRPDRDDDYWKVATSRLKSAKLTEEKSFLRVPLTQKLSRQHSVFCLT